MSAYANKTKKELLEIIENREETIALLRKDILQLEKCEKYDHIADEITSMYKRFYNNFGHDDSMELTKCCIAQGLIPAYVPQRPAYYRYR